MDQRSQPLHRGYKGRLSLRLISWWRCIAKALAAFAMLCMLCC